MVYSGIAKARELTNSTCDFLGILALKTVENKSVDYEYNELKVYLWSIMILYSGMQYITAQMRPGGCI